MLEEGDIIELKNGMRVYASVPEHFLYENRRGVFHKTSHGQIEIGGELHYFAGRYVVYKTALEGGGAGHGQHDVYPNGHHVYAEKLNNPGVRVDFYQSGAFTAMLPNLEAIGKAEKTWSETKKDVGR